MADIITNTIVGIALVCLWAWIGWELTRLFLEVWHHADDE